MEMTTTGILSMFSPLELRFNSRMFFQRTTKSASKSAPRKEAVDDEEEPGKAVEADVRESPTHPCLPRRRKIKLSFLPEIDVCQQEQEQQKCWMGFLRKQQEPKACQGRQGSPQSGNL